jgi:phosphonate transport system substrate-binding protein
MAAAGAALVLAGTPLTSPAADAPELYLGSVAMDIPSAMYRRLKPLADYLTRELGRPVQLRLSSDLTRASNEVAAGAVDIAYLTPVAYIKAQRAGQARLLVKCVTAGQGSLHLMIVSRSNSRIRSVADLAGKSFAFGDPAAILQRAVVVNAGLPLEKLGSYKFIGHYDNIARGITSGEFDAGILKDTTAAQWVKRGELRLVHTSPGLPPYNLAVSKRVDDRLAAQMQKALLALKLDNPEHRRVIQALDPNYTGFAATSDAEYEVVRVLTRPFDK